MFVVADKGAGITPGQLIPVVAFQVKRRSAKIAACDKAAHSPCDVTKLIIMACGYFKAARFRESEQFFCLRGVDGKRFFYVDMRAVSQALTRDGVMALWRGRDVHDVRPAYKQHFGDVTETCPDRKPLLKLARHQFLAITDRNDFAIGNPPDLRGM